MKIQHKNTIIAELPNIIGKHATGTRQHAERIPTYYNEYVISG
tara:strand:+ start:5323 stop:5451 length:129 start_codon:yes stop_codon:yes gene_type:complete